MIISEHDGPYQDILLYSLHNGEGYDSMFEVRHPEQDRARSFIVADFFHLHEAGLDCPPEWNEKLKKIDSFSDTDFGVLYLVSGKVQQHINLLKDFYAAIKDGPRGGDDDYYDYWPGAVEMFVDYARDLANWNKSTLALVRQLGRHNKDVSEFEETAQILINTH